MWKNRFWLGRAYIPMICWGLWQAEKWFPNDVYILIPRNCEHITLDDKRDFVDVIKLMILQWRDYPASARWALYKHKGTRRGQSQNEGNVIMEAEGEKVMWYGAMS